MRGGELERAARLTRTIRRLDYCLGLGEVARSWGSIVGVFRLFVDCDLVYGFASRVHGEKGKKELSAVDRIDTEYWNRAADHFKYPPPRLDY